MGRKKSKGWKGQGNKYHLNVKTNALLAGVAHRGSNQQMVSAELKKIRRQLIFFFQYHWKDDDSCQNYASCKKLAFFCSYIKPWNLTFKLAFFLIPIKWWNQFLTHGNNFRKEVVLGEKMSNIFQLNMHFQLFLEQTSICNTNSMASFCHLGAMLGTSHISNKDIKPGPGQQKNGV